jgi:hypothetical protein
LSFGKALQDDGVMNVAIAKFTHSGSQIIDWTPEGSVAKPRNLYPRFIAFIEESLEDLQGRGHEVELAGIFYHLGENDMSFGPHRQQCPLWLQAIIAQSRIDLQRPDLTWFVSQQPPTDDKSVNAIDVTAALEEMAAADPGLVHVKAFELPGQAQKLVITTEGIVQLGEVLARSYLDRAPKRSAP